MELTLPYHITSDVLKHKWRASLCSSSESKVKHTFLIIQSISEVAIVTIIYFS